jgi:glycosyltransferase involved in cell wall biosynthesis
VNYLTALEKKRKTTSSMNICSLGGISFHKGRDIVIEMLEIIKRQNLNINIVNIGTIAAEIRNTHFKCSGQYIPSELPKLMRQYDIDVVFISSIWPETFCYTCEEAMMMDMPVACFNLGAPPERVASYHKGAVIKEISPQCALDTLVELYQSQNYILPRRRI